MAQLQAEYLRVGDQLEGEQTRIMQVPLTCLRWQRMLHAHHCSSWSVDAYVGRQKHCLSAHVVTRAALVNSNTSSRMPVQCCEL